MEWAIGGALLIGLCLGIMGSGGSILTVPVLTYLLGQDEKVAIAGSLGIVGAISLVASLPYARNRLVHYRSVFFMGVPAMAGVYVGAFLSQFVSGSIQLLVFAILMLFAGGFMLRTFPSREHSKAHPRAVLRAVFEGIAVGAITGFVGVGGGFLIVPALVVLGGLSMRRAVGTSLLIIALNSLTGFIKYLDILESHGLALDWEVLGTFIAVGIVGSFAGKALSAKLPQGVLKRSFAIFLFAVGSLIVVDSWPRLFAA